MLSFYIRNGDCYDIKSLLLIPDSFNKRFIELIGKLESFLTSENLSLRAAAIILPSEVTNAEESLLRNIPSIFN